MFANESGGVAFGDALRAVISSLQGHLLRSPPLALDVEATVFIDCHQAAIRSQSNGPGKPPKSDSTDGPALAWSADPSIPWHLTRASEQRSLDVVAAAERRYAAPRRLRP